jgi:sugar transferase (PEP-CTERM system associated)
MGKTLLILMGGDVLIAILAHYFGFFLWLDSTLEGGEIARAGIFRILLFAVVLILTSYLSNLYSREKPFRQGEGLVRIGGSLLLAFLLLSALYVLVPAAAVEHSRLLLALGAFGLIQYIWHNRFALVLHIPGVEQKVLILGVGPAAKQLEKSLEESENNFVLAGFIQPAGESAVLDPSARILGTMDMLVDTALREKVKKIIVSMSERRGVLPVRDILKCKLNGIAVVDGLSFYEEITGKLAIENINPSWFIFSDGFRLTPFMHLYKRAFDLFFAALGLLLTMPILPLLALAIRLESPGPILFRQLRVGENEIPFLLYKFRSMRQDAESATGAVWAQVDDPRVTRLGNFLRKSRLDEIPQLFNVLKGEMSFVGPRPERPEFIEKLKERIPYYGSRHCVKPGVTGWAQVSYPYGASEADALEKLRYDLYYIKNYSLPLDFLIILETVKVVLCGKGGR